MGIPTLIATNTESGDAASAFTSGIDGTYDEYMYVCTDINPALMVLIGHFREVQMADQAMV